MASNNKLSEIKKAIYSRKRISEEAAVFLLSEEVSLGTVGELAHFVRTTLHGKKAYYVKNFHLNLTNICQSSCKFCSFRKKADDEGAYALTVEESIELARRARDTGATEVHIVNALNPNLPFDYYLSVIKGIKKEAPELTIKGFTAVEIDFFAQMTNISYRDVILSLAEAGVKYLPGGGAEIFNANLRARLGTSKIPGSTWLEIHELAHRMGIPTNATLLYGHFEQKEDIVEHLSMLRGLQDRTRGFEAFIPLKFVPYDTEIKIEESSSVYDLKVTAVSRLFLDNIPHIKAYWVTLTTEIAQIALSFGADDIDGTIMKEKIIHAAGAKVEEGMAPEELSSLIFEAGFEPVERNSFYAETERAVRQLC